MLYLTRRKGESIIINGNISLEVVELKGSMVKLGFTFPSDATILRKEIHDKIRVQNEMAAGQNQAMDAEMLDALALFDGGEPPSTLDAGEEGDARGQSSGE